MGGLHRIVRPDGSIEYTDVPSGAGEIEAVQPGAARPNDAGQRATHDHQLARDLIKEAQKRIPKVTDYLDYIDYLRHNSPVRFDRVMDELRRQDPQTWLKLQQHPQFRPLRETAIGLRAGGKLLGASVGLASGNFTGSAEKWMESTLKDLMKRDRFGPYADVLGAKASTLPTKPTSYSNSRLGQYLKGEDVRAAAAAKAALRDLETSQAGLRAAKAGIGVKIFGPIVDIGMGTLNVENAIATTNTLMRSRLESVARRNPVIDLDSAEYAQARTLLNQERYGELDAFLKRFE